MAVEHNKPAVEDFRHVTRRGAAPSPGSEITGQGKPVEERCGLLIGGLSGRDPNPIAKNKYVLEALGGRLAVATLGRTWRRRRDVPG